MPRRTPRSIHASVAAVLTALLCGCAADRAQGPATHPVVDITQHRTPAVPTPAEAPSESSTESPAARPAWPARNTGSINALDLQGRTLMVPAGTETWLTGQPDRPVGDHVLVLDFWATWCRPCITASPKLDRIQRDHEGDVLVLAFSGLSAGKRWPEDEATIRRYIESHPVAYAHLHDPSRAVYQQIKPSGIPHAVVISTDGVVRWQGNPHDPRFPEAVDAVVRADPGLAERRARARSGG